MQCLMHAKHAVHIPEHHLQSLGEIYQRFHHSGKGSLIQLQGQVTHWCDCQRELLVLLETETSSHGFVCLFTCFCGKVSV